MIEVLIYVGNLQVDDQFVQVVIATIGALRNLIHQ